MLERRWLRWLGPGAIALATFAGVASTASGAGERPWTPRDCGPDDGDPVSAARWTTAIEMADLAAAPWFRLDPRLDRDGALEGQRLALGIYGERAIRVMLLPPESFAAGSFGRVILVGADDGATSRLDVVDVVGGCAWAVASEAAVVRRATIEPGGDTILEMRVDRATRADLGIWARPIDGHAPPTRILGPIEADDRFGRTYTTEFWWDLDGRRLAVQSCGERACRTRILDPASGSLDAVVADPALGPQIGLAGRTLVSYEACPGLPCPIVATDLASGAQTLLAEAAANAVLTAAPAGPRLVHEAFGVGNGLGLRAIAFDGSAVTELGPIGRDLRLHPAPNAAEAGIQVPGGWVLLGPDGRLPASGPDGKLQLRRITDGATVQLEEVAR